MRFSWIAIIMGIASCGTMPNGGDASSPSDAKSEATIADVNTSEAKTDSSLDSSTYASSDTGLDARSDTATGVTDASVSTCRYWPRDSGSQCSTLPSGAVVNVGCMSSPPVPMGGTLVDGYYELTEAVYDFGVPDGGCPSIQGHKSTLEICGNQMVWTDYDVLSHTRSNDAFTWSTKDTTLHLEQACLGNSKYSLEYTATKTQMILFVQYNGMGPHTIMTFTRMPNP